MNLIQQGELPTGALLEKYKLQGAHTDCYFVDLPKQVSHSDYIEAFYTSGLFKLERYILALFVRRPSTDQQAIGLAHGEIKNFAAWHVEAQNKDQLLLCDFMGRTRSWLMSISDEGNNTTRLYFGSAGAPKRVSASGKVSFGFVFHALSTFHHLYSKALLKAACSRLLL